ncbi:transcriptional regulator with XRE-family HTH domain [Paenibacillus sp. 1182]|uniref:helix-turn-helix transcriptional regulator n=1 Tax=Paenibacillus sp. 1182 TaxID=2806565 RepID=UPI001AE14B48|nr:helix-turn-helix transcriptional regulator [Paenibacillus sp. 1182]MBP1308742.1 transcriptional regulator with XRE-family HTH domain [Paenibacillus sp. 1182]
MEDFFDVLKKTGKQPIKNLSELKENDLYIIENDTDVVEVFIPQLLNEKGLLISELAKLTGTSRQYITSVIRNKMRPGIDFALKVSFVLGEPIENIFKLTENYWFTPVKLAGDSPVYIDLFHMQLIDSAEKRRRIQEDKFEYFNKTTKEKYSKAEYEKMLKSYVDQKIQTKDEKNKEDDSTLFKNELKTEFSCNYSKIYKKIGRKMTPYSLDMYKRW